MLWNSRFKENMHEDAFEFSKSISFDINLLNEDIEQNIAHCKMLNTLGIIRNDELEEIITGLNRLPEIFTNDENRIISEYEDIHTAIEKELKQLIGDTADKIHTGRSRNDQVATITRMWIKNKSEEIINSLINLQKIFVQTSKEHLLTLLPGYTHLQWAQPVSLAHHLLAYVEMFERDKKRFQFVFEEADESPLGSGALAGSTIELNREMTADLLHFNKISTNSMDAVSDRDYIADFLNACSLGMVHLSKFCEEIILWSTKEWNFVELPDEFSTGSSLMPQKKNPDFNELIRGKTSRVISNQFNLLGVIKGTPLTYNRDFQEDKEPLFDSYKTYFYSIKLISQMTSKLKINSKRFADEINGDFIFATDIADWLVIKGVPFRQAHNIVGGLVRYCESNKKKLNELTLEEYRKFSSLFNDDVYSLSSAAKCLERKKTVGSPNPEYVSKEINKWEKFLN